MSTDENLHKGLSAYIPYFMVILLTAWSINSTASSLTIAGLPDAVDEDHPVCYDQTTGKLGNCDLSLYGSKARIAWVAKDGTGDYSSPIDALYTNSLNQWCPDRSITNRCLLRIAPGIYDLGSSTLTMRDYIDIEGSGQGTTLIRGAKTTYGYTSGLVRGANAALRSLSLSSTSLSGATEPPVITAIYSEGGLTIKNVEIYASGGGGATDPIVYGLNNRGGRTVVQNSTIIARGGLKTRAVYVRNSAVYVISSEVFAYNASSSNRTILTYSTVADPTTIAVQKSVVSGDISIGTDTNLSLSLSDIRSSVIYGLTSDINCKAVISSTGFNTTTCP